MSPVSSGLGGLRVLAVIAVYSVKGGVGKTTIAANLAWCSAAISCRKTLLWDLDAAGGAGFLFGVDPRRSTRPKACSRRTPIPSS